VDHSVPPALPIFLFALAVIGLAAGLLALAHLFNPSRPGRVKRMPYESGMDPIHDTRRRFDVRFHLLAIAFLVFDVELLFLYPWAVASHRDQGPEVRGQMVATKVQGSGFRVQGSAIGGQRSATSDSSSPVSPHPSPLTPHPSAAGGIDRAVANRWVESRDLVFGGAMIFLGLLVLGFVYDWRKGVFQWR
jgi:NADH-quinone oxidoreductase subunit A